ncbi:type III secretion system export apparatus subunit SctV [Pseudomonas sp. DNDY-54]|uniref:type III secretion system export apparatus subunit SctV n=1 Tax=Pseudomonas sp. DNDY-54 TaxID=2870860 RepID=UPI001CA3C94D|nr:type III secretion system export apparatus subunit SctV [Pseudomonas sp. DNDY-54]
MMARLNALARMAAQRTDVVIVAFMLMAIAMMIIPLPTYLVDTLIAINIALSMLVLIVAFYISSPVELSTLPPLILLSTLFRLSLSITTTRLILLQGDAGNIVEAFGNFVIAGELVVGMVIFLIITIAQFIVITKGAERVAEVAARFTLDAMPGKQMSIDNDLRNGDIDQHEARRRRSNLQRESQLFGAMDGSMKFVKGDAIAALVILFVNLIGGLTIGMLKRDMSFAEAAQVYSLLTVGDGLVAQIPALLIALAAGTVVTRVSSGEGGADLGSEIIGQIASGQRALSLTAVILVAMAFVPGFPATVFIGLALLLGGIAYLIRRNEQRQAVAQAQASESSEAEVPAPPAETPSAAPENSRVLLKIGPGLGQSIALHPFQQRLEALRNELHAELGIEFPLPAVHLVPSDAAHSFRIELEGIPLETGELSPDRLLYQDDPLHLELLDVQRYEAGSPLTSGPATWIARAEQPGLDEAGIGYLLPEEVLTTLLGRTLRRHAGDFLGIQETRQLLARMEEEYPELVTEAVRVLPVQRLAEALRGLVREGVSIRNSRALLEAMVEWNGKDREGDAQALIEHLRRSLARQISHQHADGNRVISAFVIGSRSLGKLLDGVRDQDGARGSAKARELFRRLLRELRQCCEALPEPRQAVLVVHPELRPFLARICAREELELAVLSFTELAAGYNLQAIKVINTDSTTTEESVAVDTSTLVNAS